ncbi:MAG TPA: 30S ribosomal protein S3 [Candidatus Paceibacterota bacterium]|nr:30S ribosomal protein S3 [Candidatus Paceibacterota bacterium]
MAQKTKPNALRLGVTTKWSSQWFFRKDRRFFLQEDELIRKVVKRKILQAGIAGIEIERTGDGIRVSIRAARPGLIIGRGGKGIEDLRNELLKEIKALRRKAGWKGNFTLNLNVEELKRMEISASVVAQQVAFDIERRLPYRTAMRQQMEGLKQNKGVKGGKIKISGRLNGAEISRSDWQAFGRMPLQTLRANIDYGEATAYTTYGTVGIKVWLYKGDIFEEKSDKPSKFNQ